MIEIKSGDSFMGQMIKLIRKKNNSLKINAIRKLLWLVHCSYLNPQDPKDNEECTTYENYIADGTKGWQQCLHH